MLTLTILLLDGYYIYNVHYISPLSVQFVPELVFARPQPFCPGGTPTGVSIRPLATPTGVFIHSLGIGYPLFPRHPNLTGTSSHSAQHHTDRRRLGVANIHHLHTTVTRGNNPVWAFKGTCQFVRWSTVQSRCVHKDVFSNLKFFLPGSAIMVMLLSPLCPSYVSLYCGPHLTHMLCHGRVVVI